LFIGFPLDVIRVPRYNACHQVSLIVSGASVEIILILALIVLVIIGLGIWIAQLEYRHRQLTNSFRMLMTGRGGADLEASLLDFVARMDRVEQIVQANESRVANVEAKWPYLVQHVGIVRFNPYPDKGGDQSFVLALLDNHTDGVVLSALHGRTDVRVYAKPVIGGQSTYTLTAEEKEAIARAMKPKA
jgi:hypothetical protein